MAKSAKKSSVAKVAPKMNSMGAGYKTKGANPVGKVGKAKTFGGKKK